MRIIVVDTDVAFTTSISQRFKKANVFCQVFPQAPAALAEIKKDPDGVDLVLIAKELGAGQDGQAVAEALRKDAKMADVPYIIMSTTWGKAEFAKHQKTEFGANAYYSKKNPQAELEATIEAVTGFKFAPAEVKGAPAAAAQPPKKKDSAGLLNIQLQVASDIVNFAEDIPGGIAMEEPINLFADDGFAEEPVVPVVPVAPAAPVAAAPVAAAPTPPAAPVAAAPVAPAAPVAAAPTPPAPPAEIPVSEEASLQIEAGTVLGKITPIAPPPMAATPAPVAAAPVATAPLSAPAASAGDGIAIDVASNGMDFQLETTNKPVASAPPPASASGALEISLNAEAPIEAAAPVATAPAADGGGLEISLGSSAEVEVAAPAAAPVPAPAADAGAFSIESESFTLAGMQAPQAPPEPQAQAPTPTPTKSITKSQPAVDAAVSEEEAARDLPYLFAGSGSGGTRKIIAPSMGQVAAMSEGSAGGPLSNDVETLKKYLTMREQDVSVLTAQLSYAQEELGKSEETIKRLSLQGEDLFHQIDSLKKKIEGQAQELEHANRNREGELEQLRLEVKSKIDRIKFLEERLEDSADQYEKLKDRVRLDIRKIRVREKELESKLEILKKDSETLIAARENKILELKRKIDLLEFNYDTLQDKNEAEKQNVHAHEEKLERIQKVLKLAMGIIEAEGDQAGEAKAKKSLSDDILGAGAKGTHDKVA